VSTNVPLPTKALKIEKDTPIVDVDTILLKTKIKSAFPKKKFASKKPPISDPPTLLVNVTLFTLKMIKVNV